MQNVMIEGFCPFGTYQTWYRITGDLKSDQVPLIVLHGGPGCTHDYLENYAELSKTGRPIIHYDQLGNGKSTHVPDAPKDFWTVELFLSELDNLLKYLGVQSRYALLGQSWGGMLAAEHAVRQPKGLKSLVIANSPSSFPLWVEEAIRLRKALPNRVHERLQEHERNQDFQHPDYIETTNEFYEKHVCRKTPWPEEVLRTFQALEDDSTVYHTMNGPTEFHVIGTLKNWTIKDRLHRINAPTLVLSGRFDEATERTVEAYAKKISDAEWLILGKSSHMPHIEEKELCLAVVSAFLTRKGSA